MKKKLHKAILLLKKIPKGKVVTYKELAKVCKTSPRAIGSIMTNNPYPEEYPCYKVVASHGELCGYSGHGGIAEKQRLLAKDGVTLHHGKVAQDFFYHFS